MDTPSSGAGVTRPNGIPKSLVWMLAVATGIAVANNYYAQPLLASIRGTFHASTSEAGLIVTASQIGYAVGLIFLLPLGDLLERRRLVVVMSLLCSVGLVGSALAPSLGLLYAAVALMGATTVVAQLLVTFAASLSNDDERGRVVGSVMSGLLLGILLARTVAGYLAEVSSWRVVFVVAAGVMAVLSLVLSRALPPYVAEGDLTYPAILRSVWSIFLSEPVLRRRSLYGLLSFAAFSVLWTSLAFLLSGAPYHYGSGTIGLFGLVGAAGAAMASAAGRLADRGHQAIVTTVTALAMLVAFIVLWVGSRDLAAVIAGIVILDLGCQGVHVSNQSQIYKLAPTARARVNAAYMTCYFIGGTLGSVGSALCFSAGGWGAVCGLGVGAGGLAWILSIREPFRVRHERRQPPATAGTIDTVTPSATAVSRPSK